MVTNGMAQQTSFDLFFHKHLCQWHVVGFLAKNGCTKALIVSLPLRVQRPADRVGIVSNRVHGWNWITLAGASSAESWSAKTLRHYQL